jgi:hypothetical protein
MAESIVNVTEGSGKKLHTFNRTIGANSVEDEVVLFGLPYVASYSVVGPAVSLAVAATHVLQLTAGASLNVVLHRFMVYQTALATAAALSTFRLMSITTAGTGGGATTPFRMDNSDAASGAAGMTVPTAKGTESRKFWEGSYMVTQTVPAAGGPSLMFDVDFDKLGIKKPVIPAGTTNGVVFTNLTALAAATCSVTFWFSEVSFL